MTTSIICNYCNGNHTCRKCPIEKKVGPPVRKIVGLYMEYFVSKEINCPRCNENALCLLGTHAPSLDLTCSICNTNFEIKSKCLSATDIPNDLVLNHGNYFDYLERQKSGLDFIIIIYGVDRKTKVINIRKVFYASHEMMINRKYINVMRKKDSSLSEISIPNTIYIPEIVLDEEYFYDFSENISYIINSNLSLEKN